MKKDPCFIIVPFLFLACSGSVKNVFVESPLNREALQLTELPDQTPLHITGYAGGPEKQGAGTYYYQFLTVSPANDTIRVLCPLISTPPADGNTAPTYMSPLQYDYHKGVYATVFDNLDSSHERTLRFLSIPTDELTKAEGFLQAMRDEGIPTPEILVSNTVIPSFDRPSYKTVIGVLHFSEIPW